MQRTRIKGKVVSGARKAAGFTRLPWVEAQCLEKLGFKPYPGTLNVQIPQETVGELDAIERRGCGELIPPDPSFCSARIIPVFVGTIAAAVVRPSEEVCVHGGNILEVIAPVCLRDALGVDDGDEVTLAPRPWPMHCVLIRGAGAERSAPVKAVIFDLDGTLLDTRDIFFTIIDRVFERLALSSPAREVLVEATAEGEFDWRSVLPESERERLEEILPRIRTIIAEISPALFEERNVLIEGASGLLSTLSREGIKLGVVTSTRSRDLNMKLRPLRDAGLQGLFQSVIAADDVPRRKPAPDPLLECAKRIGVEPRDCAYVGDMRMDIRSGKAAGMLTVGVLSGFDSRDALLAEGADLIFDSVASLRAKLEFSCIIPL